MSRGPQLGQHVGISKNISTDTLKINEVSPMNPTIHCEATTGNSTLHTSLTLSIIGKLLF